MMSSNRPAPDDDIINRGDLLVISILSIVNTEQQCGVGVVMENFDLLLRIHN